MNEKDFKAMILAYGSNDARWPETIRDDARIFVESSKGKAALEQEIALDRLLSQSLEPQEASTDYINSLIALSGHSRTQTSALRIDILNHLRQQIPELASWLRPGALIAEGATLSLALIMGLWVGGQQAITEGENVETDLSYSLLSQDIVLEEDMEDWNE